MKYENHARDMDGVIMVARDDVFTIYSDSQQVLSYWMNYFVTSDIWRDEHLKSSTPFIHLTENPYLSSVEEDDSQFQYDKLEEEGKGMTHHDTLDMGEGEEDV
jgi:hypothetical protein